MTADADLSGQRFQAQDRLHHDATRGMITDKQALEFLNRAVSINHVQAMIELGLCYYSAAG